MRPPNRQEHNLPSAKLGVYNYGLICKLEFQGYNFHLYTGTDKPSIGIVLSCFVSELATF